MLEAIKSAITEQMLPSLRNTLGEHGRGLNSHMDLRSSRLHRNSKIVGKHKNCLKVNSNPSNQDRYVRESSVDSQETEIITTLAYSIPNFEMVLLK